MRKVLIVSPYFPPANTPDLHRVRMSVRHYRALGWEAVILAVRTSSVDTMVEPELIATLPADLRVRFVRPVPRGISRFLGVGNIGWRGLPALFWNGCQLLRKEKFDLVFFSTSQFAVFPLGRIWRAMFGVPYVLDFQDAWSTDYYTGRRRAMAPGGAKFRWASLHAKWCEGWCVQQASGLIGVSSTLLEGLVQRHGMAHLPRQMIPFGASVRDNEVALSSATGARQPPWASANTLHAVSTGAAGSIMSQALQCLFAGIRQAKPRLPREAPDWRFHFLGTSYAGPGRGQFSVRPAAVSHGLAAQVEEQPDRIGHLEALRWQQRADLLILLGSNDPAYAPSKIYPYLLSGRPILAIVLRDSELDTRVSHLEGVQVIRFSPGVPRDEEAAAVADFFVKMTPLREEKIRLPAAPSRLPRDFTSDHLAAEQCGLFEAARLHFQRKEVA